MGTEKEYTKWIRVAHVQSEINVDKHHHSTGLAGTAINSLVKFCADAYLILPHVYDPGSNRREKHDVVHERGSNFTEQPDEISSVDPRC
jgi:hypothetical protein